ncbi:MAG: response regulator, partial [Rivularia sp. ALOHA_DT_140]|nr:response regulator [Rivularia sp. ALOHA_DT_140]
MNIKHPKILIIDDHRLLLNGTINLVSDHIPNAEIFSAQTAQEAITGVKQYSPDLAIADLSIPQESG